jgi:hypothetical protein
VGLLVVGALSLLALAGCDKAIVNSELKQGDVQKMGKVELIVGSVTNGAAYAKDSKLQGAPAGAKAVVTAKQSDFYGTGGGSVMHVQTVDLSGQVSVTLELPARDAGTMYSIVFLLAKDNYKNAEGTSEPYYYKPCKSQVDVMVLPDGLNMVENQYAIWGDASFAKKLGKLEIECNMPEYDFKRAAEHVSDPKYKVTMPTATLKVWSMDLTSAGHVDKVLVATEDLTGKRDIQLMLPAGEYFLEIPIFQCKYTKSDGTSDGIWEYRFYPSQLTIDPDGTTANTMQCASYDKVSD